MHSNAAPVHRLLQSLLQTSPTSTLRLTLINLPLHVSQSQNVNKNPELEHSTLLYTTVVRGACTRTALVKVESRLLVLQTQLLPEPGFAARQHRLCLLLQNSCNRQPLQIWQHSAAAAM
jgi:hypothetical protein